MAQESLVSLMALTGLLHSELLTKKAVPPLSAVEQMHWSTAKESVHASRPQVLKSLGQWWT
ncbi:MAG: hypothetical protein KIG95_13795 [Comamonas sp.]|nr:hypothetical protein [Comamonas sp.]